MSDFELLPDDASPGEIIAMDYFIEKQDFDVVEAWGIVCRSSDTRQKFAAKLEELSKRIGRPVWHIDGIHHALRFWSLAIDDPKLSGKWREASRDFTEPQSFNEIGGITIALMMWAYADSAEESIMRLADHCLQSPRRAWPEQAMPMNKIVFVGGKD